MTIASLVQSLHSKDAGERAEAAERLCRAGSEASSAAPHLTRACGDADERVREWAAAALEELGPPPEDALGELATIAGEGNPLAAYWAVTLLGRAGKSASAAVPVLVACLGARSTDRAVRERAAWALGKIGPAASAARAALLSAAAGDDARLARLSNEALAAIDR